MHEASQNIVFIEADHNAYTDETKDMRKKQMAKVTLVVVVVVRVMVRMVEVVGRLLA